MTFLLIIQKKTSKQKNKKCPKNFNLHTGRKFFEHSPYPTAFRSAARNSRILLSLSFAMTDSTLINSPESMIHTIQQYGIIPFFHGKIPGWSIEELTDPECWFTSSEQLGPWDWKIDAVRQGNIAYGKFIRNKAAFATVEWYAHLMNWRRSLPQYRIPLGEEFPGNTLMDRLYKTLSPTLLSAIKEFGAMEPTEMRELLQERTTEEHLKTIGGSMNRYLFPKIKRTAVDFLNLYLEMGTWTVIGDFRRIYRGRNQEYTGWQRSSITIPELLFPNENEDNSNAPFWARLFSDSINYDSPTLIVDCTPKESLDILIQHIKEVTGFLDSSIIRKTIQ